MDKEDIPFSKSQQQWLMWVPLSIAAVVLGVDYRQFVKPSWAMDFWQLVNPQLSEDASKWGTFGDYFGGLLHPVISACTLFVAVGVWKFQEKEVSPHHNPNKQAKFGASTAELITGKAALQDWRIALEQQTNNGKGWCDLLDSEKIATEYGLLQGLHPDRKVKFEKLLSENRNLFSTPPDVEKETTSC